jgi:hypothetical protein
MEDGPVAGAAQRGSAEEGAIGGLHQGDRVLAFLSPKAMQRDN